MKQRSWNLLLDLVEATVVYDQKEMVRIIKKLDEPCAVDVGAFVMYATDRVRRIIPDDVVIANPRKRKRS